MLKFLALCFIAGLLCAGSAMAQQTIQTTVCIQYDEPRDTYGDVDEDKTVSNGITNYTLTCLNHGKKECKFTVYDPWPRLTDYAEDRIANGVLAGFHHEIQGNLRLTVTWEVTPAQTQIIETQEETTGIE